MMQVKQRIDLIRLSYMLKNNPDYAHKLGVNVEFISKDKEAQQKKD